MRIISDERKTENESKKTGSDKGSAQVREDSTERAGTDGTNPESSNQPGVNNRNVPIKMVKLLILQN